MHWIDIGATILVLLLAGALIRASTNPAPLADMPSPNKTSSVLHASSASYNLLPIAFCSFRHSYIMGFRGTLKPIFLGQIIFPDEERAISMSGKQPSHLQKAASKAQSLADRGAAGKKRASELQSEADGAAVPKHGL